MFKQLSSDEHQMSGLGGRCSHVPCLGVWDIDLPELNWYVQGVGGWVIWGMEAWGQEGQGGMGPYHVTYPMMYMMDIDLPI